jgi:Uma2 family endonuclease
MTVADLMRAHLPGRRAELERGVPLVRGPAGYRHGLVVTALGRLMMRHVETFGLGTVVVGETGFQLSTDPDTVRVADIAFIARGREPDSREDGYPALAPDLVVDVISPPEWPIEIMTRAEDWVAAGTRLVWVVDPRRCVAHVYRADGSEAYRAEDTWLEGEDVLPGFTCAFAAIFPGQVD